MISKAMLAGALAVLPFLAYGGAAEQQRRQTERLEKAVLAPCCYREPVARHQSEIAVKMRLEIAKWVEQGRTDQEILDTYAKLYGAKVLVDPATAPKEWSYLVPWAMVVLGMIGAGLMLWRWHTVRLANSAPSNAPDVALPDVPDFDDE